jgi:Arm DNA-binding domain
MLLTDAHIRNAKPTAKAFKLSDGGGMHLIVTPANARYWRMDLSVRRTLAMGVYPTVSLATARASRDEARALLARNIDPVTAKKASKRAAELARENTFELIAREWLGKQRRRLSTKYSALLLARLVYVGVTRARHTLHLIVRKGGASPFVKELYQRARRGT